jgi:hypothetical protein
MPSDNPLTDALADFLASPAPSPSINPAPVVKRSTTSQAIKRCRAAWQRAYNATLAVEKPKFGSEYFAERNATEAGGKAFCSAMPVLAGYEGIRDFIACVAHGIVLGAVRPENGGQLLYAAQVALSTHFRAPKPPKTAPAKNASPTPSPSKHTRK